MAREKPMSESELYAAIILEATRLGNRLFRNNVGRCRYRAPNGRESVVPYGVGGPGGSDLIGWTHGGFGAIPWCRFTAIEIKGNRGSRVNAEQQAFIDAVLAAGGIAGVVRSVQDYRRLVGAE
jgi:hypothetical protein